MALYRGPIRMVRRTAGLAALAVVGAAAAQLPAFVQQYLQRLGGHLDEARFMAAEFADGAAYRELAPNVRDAVLDVAERRVETLANAYNAIAGADDLTRPLVFLTHVDHGIASAAWRVFEPGVPLGWGGLAYGGAAMLIVYIGFAGCRNIYVRRRLQRPLPQS